MSEQPESKPIQTKADSYKFRLPLRFFLRSGSELTLRHGLIVKQAAYRLFGDLNLHRRVRASYVVAALLDLKVDTGEILDAGCGEGACSLAIARGIKGCRVLGVDTDEDSISTCSKIAQLLSLQNISFERVDVRDLPFRDRFDAAVCVDMLEHVEQDVAALQNLYRALKPGGRLIVHVPMQHQLQRRILPGFKSVRVIGHVRDEYSRDEIVQKVTRAGFQVDIVRSTFGIWGELAFELNTLFSEIPGLKVAAAAMTFPFALALAYRELSSSGRKGGNSIMVIARKPAPQTDLQNSSATPVPGSGGRLTP